MRTLFIAALIAIAAPFVLPSQAHASCIVDMPCNLYLGENDNSGICKLDQVSGNTYCGVRGVTPVSTNGQSDGGFAPTGGNPVNQQWLQYYYQLIVGTINSVFVPVLIAIAFIVFIWGVYKAFIWNGASESDKAEGRHLAMWGIIGFVIILSVWGLVALVKDTVIPSGVQNTHPNYPTL